MTRPSLQVGTDLHPALAETHSAVVVFLGDRAFKLKKPVDLGFLDFTTSEARAAVCHQEVELNRRLAPDVYEGVAEVVGPDGTVWDHLVVMRRMPEDRRLSTLVRAGAPVDGALWQVAGAVAALHARSQPSPAAEVAAGVEATRARWAANTTALVELDGALFADGTVGLVHGLACRYLDGRGPLFASRVAGGRAVDGHGDLLADDIFFLPDGPRILDCIEFDEALRLGDGLADVAFLAMDLERLGRADLGSTFLQAYAEQRGDAWPVSLAHHQIAYRAQVRAKVAALRARQGQPDAGAEARALLDLALDHLQAGRVRLVVIGGLPATGKTTVARHLADRFGWVLLRTDEVRKELAGFPAGARADAPVDAGLYEPGARARAYETVLERAATALGMGESVVLDASWSDGAWRRRARELADQAAADLLELRCVAPEATSLDRMAARRAAGSDASDATPAVAAAMAQRFDDWAQATVLDTTAPLDRTLDEAARLVSSSPAGEVLASSRPVPAVAAGGSLSAR